MNSDNHNTLYVILNYALNNNIYSLITSIKNYCFSFISLSLQYNFQLYLIYNNSYILLFPSKIKDPTYFMTSNYNEMSNSILETLNNFFENVTEAENKLNPSDIGNSANAINVILKKILLEVNQKKSAKFAENGNFYLSSNSGLDLNDRIVLINDAVNDFDSINQKYVFLLKKEKIKIDILSLNEKNNNKISKSLCLYTNGFFDYTTNEKSNVEQILIQEYIPIKTKEIFQNKNTKIQNCINYNKAISDEELMCSLCKRILTNREEKGDEMNDLNNNNNIYSSMNSINTINSKNSIDGNNSISNSNSNSINNIKLYYSDTEKNIFCYNCYLKIKKQ